MCFYGLCYNLFMIESKQTTPLLEENGSSQGQKNKRGIHVWWIVTAAVIVFALIATGIFFLFKVPPAVTTQIRDVFIIFMALAFMVLGVALVILIFQLAKLVNLLQNEVKPILEASSDTINTLKGTTEFLSENLVNPVIKLNSYMAGIKKILDLMKIIHK